MDPPSKANDLQTFYSQASFYRRNENEKQFVINDLEQQIKNIRKDCVELEEAITDPQKQDKSITTKLNKKRQNLADLYVKKLLLVSEEAPFTAFYSAFTPLHIKESEKTSAEFSKMEQKEKSESCSSIASKSSEDSNDDNLSKSPDNSNNDGQSSRFEDNQFYQELPTENVAENDKTETKAAEIKILETIVYKQLANAADSIVEQAFQEHRLEHLRPDITLKRIPEMEILYEPGHETLVIETEEQQRSSSPNFDSFYNESVDLKTDFEPILQTQFKNENENKESIDERANLHELHSNFIQAVDAGIQILSKAAEMANDKPANDQSSTWHQVHISQPLRPCIHVDKVIESQKNNSDDDEHVIHELSAESITHVDHVDSESMEENQNLVQIETEEKHKEPIILKKTDTEQHILHSEPTDSHKIHINQPERHFIDSEHTEKSQILYQIVTEEKHKESIILKENETIQHSSYSEPTDWHKIHVNQPDETQNLKTKQEKISSKYESSDGSKTEINQANAELSSNSSLNEPDFEEKLKFQLASLIESRESERHGQNLNENKSKSPSPVDFSPNNEESEEEWVHEPEETIYHSIPISQLQEKLVWKHIHVEQPQRVPETEINKPNLEAGKPEKNTVWKTTHVSQYDRPAVPEPNPETTWHQVHVSQHEHPDVIVDGQKFHSQESNWSHSVHVSQSEQQDVSKLNLNKSHFFEKSSHQVSNIQNHSYVNESESTEKLKPTKIRQGVGYGWFKEIEQEVVTEENLQNKNGVHSSVLNAWRSPDHSKPFIADPEQGHQVQKSSHQHFESKNLSEIQREQETERPLTKKSGSDDEYEMVPHIYHYVQHNIVNPDDDDKVYTHDIREITLKIQDPIVEKTSSGPEPRVDVDMKIITSKDAKVERNAAISQNEYIRLSNVTTIPEPKSQPSHYENVTQELRQNENHRLEISQKQQKVFNRYEDDEIIVQKPQPDANQKVKVTYGSGYDYFKEIERSTVKEEERISSIASVRASTDRGWQSPDSEGISSPLSRPDFVCSPDKPKSSAIIPECRVEQTDIIPENKQKILTPTKEESFLSFQSQRADVLEIETTEARSSPKSIIKDKISSSIDLQQSPLSEQLTPTKITKSVRFNDSTMLKEIFQVTGKYSENQTESSAVRLARESISKPVLPSTPPPYIQSPTDVEVRKHEQNIRNVHVRKEHQQPEWMQHAPVKSNDFTSKVDFEEKALPHRRYELQSGRAPKRIDARNEKVPNWRSSKDDESPGDHPHHVDIADIDVHEQLALQEQKKQQEIKEKQQSIIITKKTGTIYQQYASTLETAKSKEIKKAVTEAAEQQLIQIKIPRSPVTITPPSTPTTIEPGPAPKMSRSVFKKLEKTIVEEELQQNDQHKEEKQKLEEKKRITEESLIYPGRKPKGGVSIYENETKEISTKIESHERKYFIQPMIEPKKVTFTRLIMPQKTSNDQLEKAEVEKIEFSGTTSTHTGFESFHQSSKTTDTAKYSIFERPEYSKSLKFESLDQNVEDFRQSKTFTHFHKASKERQELAKKKLLERDESFEKPPTVFVKPPTPARSKYQRFETKEKPKVFESEFVFKYLLFPKLSPSTKKYKIMPELEDGFVDLNVNGFLKEPEGDAVSKWDPNELLQSLYKVDYSPRIEQKRSKFRNMEGHLEIPNDELTVPEVEKEWKKVYFRTKDSRLQWFASKYADEHPIGDIYLCDAEIIPNREDYTITVIAKAEPTKTKIIVRVPSQLFEKWRQALLSHRDSNILDAYVQPILPPVPHFTEKILLIEFGTCSVRGGVLTNQPSLPQSFFPAIACVTEDNDVFVGYDALKPNVRHNGTLCRPIDLSDNSFERFKLNKDVFNACLDKVIRDIGNRPENYTVLLSIPQNIPNVFISQLLNILLLEQKFKAASIARQPSLILYSYDVTTGIVVDIGERLSIVPVIDEYVVEDAIVSLPFGAQQIRDSLRKSLKDKNNDLYAYQSPVEHTVLRYAVEHGCYVAADFDEEQKTETVIDFSGFHLPSNVDQKIVIDESSFHATEGLFNPKKWGLDVKGLHLLIHNAIQSSPIDSRRTLYKNIYLSGGTSLLHGMAERIENEIAKLVSGTIQVKVHMSPWRYHAAYLGAQVIASGKPFHKCCATKANLSEYLKAFETSAYANGN